MKEYLTTAEAAEILNVDEGHVRRLCINGTLEADKFGKSWAVKRASVEAYAKNRPKRGPKPKP